MIGIRGGAVSHIQPDFLRGQAVGGVDQVVEAVFQLQCLGRQQPCWLDRAGILFLKTTEPGGRQRVLLATGFLSLGDEGVRIEGDRVLQSGIRVRDLMLDSEPIQDIPQRSIEVDLRSGSALIQPIGLQNLRFAPALTMGNFSM